MLLFWHCWREWKVWGHTKGLWCITWKSLEELRTICRLRSILGIVLFWSLSKSIILVRKIRFMRKTELWWANVLGTLSRSLLKLVKFLIGIRALSLKSLAKYWYPITLSRTWVFLLTRVFNFILASKIFPFRN